MSIELPNIKHQTIDYSSMGTVPPDGLKIAMPVEGTTGRMTTMKITSQAQLLKEYSVTSEISPNLSDSMLHALKLLQFTPIYTSRVGSTNVLPARTDKLVNGSGTVFTDSEYYPYYKSWKFSLVHDKLESANLYTEVDPDESATPVVELLNDNDSIESGLKSTENIYSIFNNGKMISFLSTNDYGSFKVDNVVSELSKNNLTSSTKLLVAGNADLESSSGDYYIYFNGNVYYNALDYNHNSQGNPVSLRFYEYHGSSANMAYTKNREPEVRAYLIYAQDYMKYNKLTTPLLSDVTMELVNKSGYKIEVVGELSNYVSYSGSKLTYTGSDYVPNNCGFILTKANEPSLGIGIGDIGVESANYYKLGKNECSTVEMLIYRLYEVLKYNAYTGSEANTCWIKYTEASELTFDFKYYYSDSQVIGTPVFKRPTDLTAINVEVNEVTTESLVDEDSDSEDRTYFVYRDLLESEYLYSYSVGSDKYLLETLKYDDQYLTITNIKKSGTGTTEKNYIFYNGEYPFSQDPDSEYVRISSASLSYNQFLSELISALKTKFNCMYSNNGFTLFSKDTSEEYRLVASNLVKIFDQTELDPVINDYTQLINKASLIVVSTGINSENILKFSLTQDTVDPELYHLTLTRKNDEESYVIAFIKDKVDGYGVLRYFDYVNDEDNGSKYFRLVRINDDINNLPEEKVESSLFGSEVMSTESSTTDWQVAINRFREFTGDYYDFLFDGGYANVSVANTLYNTGVDLYAGVGLTLPDEKSVDNLIIYRNTLGVDHRQVVMRAPRVPDTTLGNFVVYMSPITQYLERLILNKSAGKEFAPIFGITNGSVSLAPKYRYDSEEERQRLCDVQIVPLVWDRARQLPYFLMDLTGQRADSNMSDFNNVRMDNIIAHLSDEIAQKYIGRFNDAETRSEFVGELNIAIQQRLISHQQYRINAYKIICDESNNPNEIIDLRQLIVDIYEQYRPGIRYIKIYQGIYKLSQTI